MGNAPTCSSILSAFLGNVNDLFGFWRDFLGKSGFFFGFSGKFREKGLRFVREPAILWVV